MSATFALSAAAKASATVNRRWCSLATSWATMKMQWRVQRQVVRICNARGGEGFVAVAAKCAKKFWLDHARTAAISRLAVTRSN